MEHEDEGETVKLAGMADDNSPQTTPRDMMPEVTAQASTADEVSTLHRMCKILLRTLAAELINVRRCK